MPGFFPVYVPVGKVVARLNDVCGLDWSFRVKDWRVVGSEVVVTGSMTVHGTERDGFGSAVLRLNGGGQHQCLGYDLKAACSDCLRKCATLFGVGLHLYDRTDASANPAMSVEDLATRARSVVQANAMSPAPQFQIDLARQTMMAAGYPESHWWQWLGVLDPSHVTSQDAVAIGNGTHPLVHGRVRPPAPMVGR